MAIKFVPRTKVETVAYLADAK
ncbi:uncharacterized protein G2W53_026196 [Senna tora]|uniref:Uncharacterized protein n=1 Tax=Senna tora TaxID=362788 RepID=A0A834TGH6_9FABA|nr:uncharacterized protein G2W53_026196 [Senna tora]